MEGGHCRPTRRDIGKVNNGTAGYGRSNLGGQTVRIELGNYVSGPVGVAAIFKLARGIIGYDCIQCKVLPDRSTSILRNKINFYIRCSYRSLANKLGFGEPDPVFIGLIPVAGILRVFITPVIPISRIRQAVMAGAVQFLIASPLQPGTVNTQLIRNTVGVGISLFTLFPEVNPNFDTSSADALQSPSSCLLFSRRKRIESFHKRLIAG